MRPDPAAPASCGLAGELAGASSPAGGELAGTATPQAAARFPLAHITRVRWLAAPTGPSLVRDDDTHGPARPIVTGERGPGGEPGPCHLLACLVLPAPGIILRSTKNYLNKASHFRSVGTVAMAGLYIMLSGLNTGIYS